MNRKYPFGAVKFAVALAFSVPLAAKAQEQPAPAPVPTPAPDTSSQPHQCHHDDSSTQGANPQWHQHAMSDAQQAASQAASQAITVTPDTVSQCINHAQTAAQDASNMAAATAAQQATSNAINSTLTDTSQIQALQSTIDTSAISAQTQALQQVSVDPSVNQAIQAATTQSVDTALTTATQTAAAQSAAQQAAQNAAVTPPTTALGSLDFSSTQAIYQAPNTSSIDISVGGALGANGTISGGTTHTVNPGDMLTAAQLEAVQNIMGGAQQGVLLGTQGQAIGGLISLGPQNISGAENLVVPNSVSLGLLGFDSSNPFNAGGSSSISGSVYALQNAPNLTSILNFGTLNISSSGLLTGNMSDMLGLSGWYSSNILLNVQNTLVNAGTISSPGDLAINTGSMVNSGLIAAQTGNLNIMSSMGQITNSGALTAALGNINIASAANLALDNTSGMIQAMNQINIGDVTNQSTRNIAITGGDLIASEINSYAGGGAIDIAVNELQGTLNAKADVLHVTAATDNLVLGTVNCVGDPTFYNTSGNITISGSQTFGETLAILASGSVLAQAGGNFTLQAGNATQGFDINIFSGVTITPTNPNTPSGGTVPGGQATNTVAVTAGNGGDIDFTGATVTISSRATTIDGSNKNAGNITLAAFSNAAANTGGRVLLPSTTILDARADGSGSNGNVNIYAARNTTAAVPLTTITTGSILANNGGASTGGTVDVRSAGIVIPAGLTFNTFGVPSASISAGGTRLGDIIVNNNVSSASNASFTTAGAFSQTAGTINAVSAVTVQGTLGISQTAGSSINSSTTLSLQATNGNIGSSSARINIDANTLSLAAGGANHDAFIQEANSLTLGTTTVTRTFDVIAANDINDDGGAALTATNLVLSSTSGSIGTSGTAIATTVTNLTASATASGQNVYITETNGLEIAGAQGAGNIYSLTSTSGNIANATNTAADIIAAPTVILSAGTGSIGTTAARVNVNTASLSAQANNANQNVFIQETDSVNLATSGAGATFNLLAGGNITDTAAAVVTATSVVLTSTTGSIGDSVNRIQISADNLTANATTASQNIYIQESGSVEMAGNQQAGSVYDLIAGASILNSTNPTGDVITAPTINLTAQAGSIGVSAAARVRINANDLTANALAGGQSVFIQESNSVNLGANSGADSFFNLATTAGNITNTNNVSLTATAVALTAAGGSIGTIGQRVNVTTSNIQATANSNNQGVFLSATGNVEISNAQGASGTNGIYNLLATGNITNATNTATDIITAPNVVLTSSTGSVGVGAAERIFISSTNLTATANNATSDVFISETNGVEIAGAQGAGRTYDLIAVLGNITNTTNNATDIITAPNVVVTANAGAIGSAAARINISADNLTANTTANNQSIFIADSNNINIGAASGTGTGGTFNLLAANNITNTGAFVITAPTVVLTSTSGSVGDSTNRIRINANNLTVNATSANQDAYIQEADSVEILGSQNVNRTFDLLAGNNITNNATASDRINATNVILTTTSGSIGTSTAARVQINADFLTANAGGANQDVFIQEATSVELGANSGATRTFNLATTAGNIVGNSFSINAPNVALTAVGGSVGSNTTRFNINADNLTAIANTNNQGVFLNEADSVEISGAQGAAGTNGIYNLLATGNITNATNTATDIITAPNVILTSSSGSVGLGATERIAVASTNLTANATTANQDVFIQETNGVEITGAQGAGRTYDLLALAGSITNATNNATDIISAPNIVLTANTGTIGASANRINISADNLTANAAGTNQSVFISETDNINIAGASGTGTGGTFNLLAGNNITDTGAVLITSTNVILTSTSGSIGDSANRIRTNATNLTVSATNTNQDAFIQETDNVELLGNQNVNRTFDLLAAGNITNATTATDRINATNTVLESTGGSIGSSTARINVNNTNLTAKANSANGDVFLAVAGALEIDGNVQATRTINISATGNITNDINPSGDTIVTQNLVLISTGGSIGNATNRINMNVDSIQATANTANQSVFLNETDNVEISGAQGSSGTNGIYNLLAAGDITNAVNPTGDIITAPNIVLTSTGGSIGSGTSARVNLAATNLTANATAGGIFLSETNGVEITGTQTAGTTFDLLATAGSITNNTNPSGDLITAPTIVLQANVGSIGTATNRRINISSDTLTANAGNNQNVFISETDNIEIGGGAAVSGTMNTFNLIAGNGIFNNTNPTGDLIVAATVNLTTSNGTIGQDDTSRIQINATNLRANASGASGNVFINESDSVELAGTSAATGGTFDLSAANNITNTTTPTGDAITASTVNLSSVSGSIGTATNARINIIATSLNANAGADVYISDSNAIQLTGNSSAGGIFNLTVAAGDITSAGATQLITAPNLVLNASTGSVGSSTTRINMNADTIVATATPSGAALPIKGVFLNETDSVEIGTGNTVTGANRHFDLTASGNITNDTNNATDIITAANVTLTSTNGSVGTSDAGRVNLASGNNLIVSATSAGADAFIGVSGNIEINGSIQANRTFDLKATGNITDTTGTDTITATNVALQSTTGSIGDSVNRVNINADTLSAQANAVGQNVYLFESDDVELEGPNSAGNIWSLIADGNITNATNPTLNPITAQAVELTSITGSIGSPTGRVFVDTPSVTATANAAGQGIWLGYAGDLEVDGNISAVNGVIDLFATGNITNDINPSGDTLVAQSVILNSQNGSIGNSTNAISTDTANLQANAANGSVYINNTGTGDVEIDGNQQAGDTYSVIANGSILNDVNPTGDLITAPTIRLTSNNANIGSATAAPINTEADDLYVNATSGEIHINEASAVQVSQAEAGTTLEIIADGNITTPSGTFLTADDVILESINGSIGLATNNRVNVAANTLIANANALNQDVFIYTASDIALNGPSGANRTFDLLAEGSMDDNTGTSTITATNVVLTSNTGNIGLGGPINTEAVNLTANAADGWVIISEASDVEIGGNSGASMLAEFILVAGGSITNETNPTGDIISGGDVDLMASDGSVGSTTGRINVSAGEIAVTAMNATTTADAFIHAVGDIELCGPNLVDRTFDLIADGNITDMGPSSGPWVISQNVVLETTDGSIGTATDAVEIQTTNVRFIAGGANNNVFVENQNTVTELMGDSSAAGIFNLSVVGGSLTNTTDPADKITARDVVLSTNGDSIGDAANPINIDAQTLNANVVSLPGVPRDAFINSLSSIELTGNSSATGTFSLTSQNTISDANQDANITAQNVILSSTDGSVGTNTNQRINITADTLSASAATAGQNVYIASTGNIELNSTNDAGSIYNLVANGNITDNDFDSLVTAQNLALTTLPGSGGSIGALGTPIGTEADNLTINSDTDAYIFESSDVEMQGAQNVTGIYSLTAIGDITNATNPSGDLITADTLEFTSLFGSVGGTLLAPINPINTNVNNLTVQALDNVLINEQDAVNIVGYNTAFNYYVTAGGSITLTPGAFIDGTGGETFLNATSGDITGDSTALISNLDMSLIANTGNIGDLTGGNRLNIDSGFLELIAGQDVYVNELDNTAIDLPSSAGGTFDLMSTNTGLGPTLIINIAPITAQAINISAADFLSVSDNLTATNGAITTNSGRATVVGSLTGPVQLQATGNLTMNAPNFVIGGGGNNIGFSAGATGSNGSVLLTATGALGIGIGQNVTMTSQGGNVVGGVQEPGSVGLVATAGNIRIQGDNFSATANGGNVYLSAANNLNVVGANASFRANVAYDPRGGTTPIGGGQSIYNGVGGGIAVGGQGSVPAAGDAFLAALVGLRPTVITAGLPASNTLNLSGAPYFAAVGNVAGIINNIFNVAGGPVFVSNANINGATFNSNGAGVVITPTPGGGPGGGGSGSGTGVGVVIDTSANSNNQDLITKIPTDQTKILEGFVEKQINFSKGNPTNLIAGSKTYSNSFDQNSAEVARLAKEGIVLASNSNGNFINIDKGNVVFAPNQDIVVGTHEGNVHIPKGAVVLIMETGADVAIANLHQNNTNDVKIVSGGKLVSLCPGRALLLSRVDTDDFNDVAHPFQTIGYRKPDAKKLNDSITAFKMEFSIPSAMSKVQPIRQMMKSKDPQDKRIVKNLLMNSIMLQEKTIYRGPFMTTGDISQ
ncbi:MAG: S-layer family protein [Cyanobacteria bacterium TGS_CYA1]|nr:S-layer family protein [Cyanobacteria bacterium TGS_CYA1]